MTSDPHPVSLVRSEYLARIQRVMDYIEANLGRELTLDELAQVARFSRFHFHRIFSAMVGESLYQFILRLRLHKAACQLLCSPKKSITEIALDCGFGSSATFARAFRTGFGMSATEWRAGGSKKCKTNRNACKDPQTGREYVARVAATKDGAANAEQTWRRLMQTQAMKEAQSVRVESIDAMQVAYVRHTGPYAGDDALFQRLFAKVFQWAGPRDLVGSATKVLTIYHDNPKITEPDKLRISACVTIPPGTKGEGEVGTMEIPAGKYAIAHFELDVSEYAGAWNWVCGKWLPESGFQPDDRPCFEVMLNDPKDHPQGKHIVEIFAPVKPL